MLETTINKVQYQGDGERVLWPFGFKVFSAEHLQVYITNSAGEETKLTSGYYVDLANSRVEYPATGSGLSALPEGSVITLLRSTDLKQEFDPQKNGDFDADLLEGALDKLTAEMQDFYEKVERCIIFPPSTVGAQTDAQSYLGLVNAAKAAAAASATAAAGSASTASASATAAAGSASAASASATTASSKAVEAATSAANAAAAAGEIKQICLPKVFDGEQTITPKTGNSSSLILSPNNDTSRFKIEFNGTGGHILNEKKINGTWKTIPTIRLDNNSGIEIKQIKDDETAESVITVKGNAGDGIKIQTRNTTSQEFAEISLKNNSFNVKNTLGNGNTQLGKIGISANGAISLETVSTAKINGNDILTAADKGVNNGVASLGNDGKVPSAQLPNIDTLPSQTGNSGRFLTTDGTNPSWADVLPSFPAPSETVNEVSYTAAGGTSQILYKEIQSITFNAQDTSLFNPAIFSGPEEMSFYIGRTSAYVPADDVLLTFNFSISNNVVSYAELVATRNGSSLGSIAFITDLGNGPQFTPWDSSFQLGNGINIYWDSTNKKIVSDLNFKPASLTALGDAIDNVFVFETITKNNALPAASAYANKLAYVYETGTYSDIKNLIYSDGTNWNFLPGAVIQIPDERMHDTVQRVIPAYCGIALKTGQLAIPCRNKTYDADNDNTDDIYNNYSIGQMHEFCVDTYSWLNRYWNPMNFGTIFHNNIQWLTQNEEYTWAPEITPDMYSTYTFVNNEQTTYTQTVRVNLLNYANFCQWVFAQGTNKIKLEFENATNAKVFLNGSAVDTSSDLLLDADSKTYIANFYNYSDSSGYLVMDIKELPYSGGGGGAPTLTWYKNNTGYSITIADTSSANLVKVYKNGILLEPTEDYSISGTTLTLTTALVATDKITTEVF